MDKKQMSDVQKRNLDKLQQKRRRASLERKPSKHAEEMFRTPAYTQKGHAE